MRGNSVKSRFVATEVAHYVREDVYAGTPGLKAVRLLISLAAARGWKISVFDVVAAFIHAPIDELVVLLPPRGMLPEDSVFVLQEALYGTRRASRLWATTLHAATERRRVEIPRHLPRVLLQDRRGIASVPLG